MCFMHFLMTQKIALTFVCLGEGPQGYHQRPVSPRSQLFHLAANMCQRKIRNRGCTERSFLPPCCPGLQNNVGICWGREKEIDTEHWLILNISSYYIQDLQTQDQLQDPYFVFVSPFRILFLLKFCVGVLCIWARVFSQL